MSNNGQRKKTKPTNLDPTDDSWGAKPDDNFGYATEEERRANRGLEDWEMLDRMSDSQPGVFAWLHSVAGAVIAGVLVFAVSAYAIYYFTYHYGTVLFKNWHWF